MRSIFWLIPFLLLSFKAFPNAAAPGFFNAGAGQGLQLFFPEDASLLDSVRMEHEVVTILLYEGFAVVKGQYYMRNLGHQSARLRVGYPVNAFYDSDTPGPYHVRFDSLAALRVRVDGLPVETRWLADESAYSYESAANWHVWEADFKPDTLTLLEVYFMVNTNDALVREGYNLDKVNGFIYLLESGNAWAGDIGSGRVFIKAMQGLTLGDITGIEPDSLFRKHPFRQELVLDFANLEPGPSDNILLRFGTRIDRYRFDRAARNAETFYAQADSIDAGAQVVVDFLPFRTRDLFAVQDESGRFMGLVLMLNIFAPMLMLLGVIGFVVWMAVKSWRRRKAGQGQ